MYKEEWILGDQREDLGVHRKNLGDQREDLGEGQKYILKKNL